MTRPSDTRIASGLALGRSKLDGGCTAPADVLPDVSPGHARPVRAGTVLLLGNYRAALAAARQLSAEGHRVILGSEPGASCAEHSRAVDMVWHCPALVPGSPEFITALRALLRRVPGTVTIMPMIERALNTIASFEEELAQSARLALPEARVLAILHDKHRSLVFARDAGLDVPAFATAGDQVELEARAAEIGYPVVVRPIDSGCRIERLKAVTLNGPPDIAEAFDPWPAGLSAVLLQRRFIGTRTNVYFAALEGRILAEQHSLSLRTDRVDGTGQTIEGVTIAPIPAISREIGALVRRIGYTGVGCAQFLYDEAANRPCYLEINARFGASHAFVEKVGMGLTELALNLAWNAPRFAPARAGRYDEGSRFVWTLGDLSGLLFALRRGDVGPKGALVWLGRALLAAVRSEVHVTWSIRDPVPTLILYARSIGNNLGLRKRAR